MSRNDLIDVINFLKPGLSRVYLEGLTDTSLEAYYVHLRALRVMRLMDEARV